MMSLLETKAERDARTSTDDEKWQAVLDKDATKDGKFYYAVKTTGVYCLPSCPARPPLRENIVFYPTLEDAEKAGFRPCKRCWPKGPSKTAIHEAAVAKACRLIAKAEEAPTLDELAKEEALGMTPEKFRKGGVGARIRFAVGECSLGSVLVAASEKGVCAISLGDDPDSLVRDLQDQFSRAELIGGDREFEKLVAQVVGYIEAPRTRFDLPLDVRGTAFQLRV